MASGRCHRRGNPSATAVLSTGTVTTEYGVDPGLSFGPQVATIEVGVLDVRALDHLGGQLAAELFTVTV